MSNIDPQNAQQIVQFLATYGAAAGIAAAGAAGTGAVQALGSGSTKAIKSLWDKVRHKSKQEGEIAARAVTAFEANPKDTEYQLIFSFVLKQLCSKDYAFADEITHLFNEIRRDPLAAQFIQYISGNAQAAMTGVNYGPVTIHQQAKEQRDEDQLEIVEEITSYEATPQLSRTRIAGTIITVSGEEAALVVYMEAKWLGQMVEVKSGQDLNEYSAVAPVVARSAGNTIVYAAIFPRLPILSHLKPSYENQKSGTYQVQFREFSPRLNKRKLLELQEIITLFTGNVAELDWRRKKSDFSQFRL